jgi:2-pyrone-4,6-dicarboxylate lactonase
MTAIQDATEIALHQPAMPLPAGAWDCHAHVFGPFDVYPLPEARRYDPPQGSVADYLQMLDATGFAKGVLVHGAAYGFDNSCLEEALVAGAGRIVGVAAAKPTLSDEALARLHKLGVRAMRFTVTHERARTFPGSLDFADLAAWAPRFKALGWHAQVWANCSDIVANQALLGGCDIPIVFDHLGYPKSEQGTNDADWQRFVAMIGDEDYWVKLTPLRITKDEYFEGARPFHDAVLEAAPDRALFGTDWPYIGRDVSVLNPAMQIDVFDAWTNDPALRQKIFVDNPERLFGKG